MRALESSRSRLLQFRALGWIVVLGMLAAALVGPLGTMAVENFNPGQNGKPTTGERTDLKGRGGDVALTFQANTTISCDADGTAQSFNIKLDYVITGAALPADSDLVVYLSPNQGAINNHAGGDAAAYISAVESNRVIIPLDGLSGSGTLSFTINVTTPFQLNGGGVLGVIATDIDGTQWNSKTNSVQCAEAQSAPPSSAPPSSAPPSSAPPSSAPPSSAPPSSAPPSSAPPSSAPPSSAPPSSAPPSSAPPSSAPPSSAPPSSAPPSSAPPSVAPTSSAQPSAAPTGSSLSETATPDATLPRTDVLAGEVQRNTDSWRLVIVAIAGLLAAVLVLTPSRRRR